MAFTAEKEAPSKEMDSLMSVFHLAASHDRESYYERSKAPVASAANHPTSEHGVSDATSKKTARQNRRPQHRVL
jgi:hypothetical protein